MQGTSAAADSCTAQRPERAFRNGASDSGTLVPLLSAHVAVVVAHD